ncbi:MAG: hypothetical protein AUI52_05510 [Acidobacteria bacterium 13_1_40CM_2_68_10]|nr:MAG: hypothetical protein AUI52_05510 [Acidobacteria bacterium 13_1_40CM_2_68_10]
MGVSLPWGPARVARHGAGGHRGDGLGRGGQPLDDGAEGFQRTPAVGPFLLPQPFEAVPGGTRHPNQDGGNLAHVNDLLRIPAGL